MLKLLQQRYCQREERDQQRRAGEAVSQEWRGWQCRCGGVGIRPGQGDCRFREDRLLHDSPARYDLFDSFLEMMLMDLLCEIGDGLGRRRQGCFQHGVLDISAAHFVLLCEGLEVDVGSQRRSGRMELHFPNLDALCFARQLEEDVGANAPFKGRIEVRGKIGGEDDDPGVPVELLQEHIDNTVRFALRAVVDGGGPTRCDRIGFVEEQDSLAFACGAEERSDIFRGFAHPHGLEFSVSDDQKPAAQGVRDGFSADGFAGARGAGEVEGEAKAGGVPFPKTPASEDQIVLCDLGHRRFQSAAGRGRQDDVLEGAARREGFDRGAAGRAEEA